jgi:hypothetical protein
MISQLDSLSNEYNSSKEARKRWNQQNVELKNSMNKVWS